MLERAEQTLERGYRELQYILLAEYQDKKLEREDTDTSLVHNSIIEDNKNDNNQENDNDFIFSNNLRLLPKVKTKENIRYGNNNKKEEDNRMKMTARNFNINTLSAPKLQLKTASKIYIHAKTKENLNNTTASKIRNNNFRERNNKYAISLRARNIKPMNLREKITINAKNKMKF